MHNNLLVIRPVEKNDIDDLFRLSQQAGSGMTSLPADRDALSRNIHLAEQSFSRLMQDRLDYFLLVMQDTETGKVVGTAGVYAKTGTRQAFYAYRLMSVTHYSHSLEKENRAGLLHLTNDYTDSSEVGTLFLDPDYRGNGHWLSRSRYMLMAQHPERFAPDVIAELRGIIDENGESPFWNDIGAHFFGMSYDEADRLCGIGSNQFITELMPKYPIYTNLLSEAAQKALGQPHVATRRAMDLLLAEGFVYENLIDIFDAGPLVRGQIDQLKSVRAVRPARVSQPGKEKKEGAAGESMILANRSLADIRIVYQPAKINKGEIQISIETMSARRVQAGEQIMYISENGPKLHGH